MPSSPLDYSTLESGRDCNYWELDRTIQSAARRAYDDEEFEWAEQHLSNLGRVTGTTVVENSEIIDRNGPELHTYDRWGEVQNEVEYHPRQHENERITYSEFGLSHDVFHAPPDRDEPLGFVHTLTMETLLSFADPGFVCPVAMTVGAAIVLDRFGESERSEEYFRRLTTRDPDEYIEGAMFLTEKQGGSDVGANETTAVEADIDEEGIYHLTGEKWFCSNIDSEGTLALARREDAPEGTAGLSLFLVPHTKANDELNDQVYRRLKDKLGTISVPTGEVEFHGAEGYLIGEPEEGFRYITEMLNFERLSNAAASVGIMGRCLLESKVQAANREAFGQTIDQFPLMRRDLVEMAVDYEAAAAFVFETARLFDAAEENDDAHRLLRLLVPIAKYRTAREAVDTASYACEVLGGNGYVQGFATARLLRDAQVLPIWEGTSNILSLDVLRVLNRENAHAVLMPAIQERLDSVEYSPLSEYVATVENEFTDLQNALVTLANEDREYAQLQAKELVDYIYDVFVAAELLAVAQDTVADGNARMALIAQEFIEKQFERSEARGIMSGVRRATEAFDTIIRYAEYTPEQP
jgi:acyl-CoA dehydrogenase